MAGLKDQVDQAVSRAAGSRRAKELTLAAKTEKSQ
jgi:hypothetical protein